jgi:dTDP-D-glucose 4,6-dehydratase
MTNLPTHKPQTLPPFDELVRMAENDPEAFEQFRQDMVREMIESASESMQPRLWAQQSHIDRVINNCKNPHHTNVVLMNELQKQVMKFREALQGAPQAEKAHNVVQFRSMKDNDDVY